MTTTTNETRPAKKPNYTKIFFTVIGVALAIIGIDRFTFDILPIGAHITADSKEITVSPIADSAEQGQVKKVIPTNGSTVDPTNSGSLNVVWLKRTVIIKSTSNLNWLLSAFPGAGNFIVTAESGDKIQVNDYTTAWLQKSDFELVSQ